MIAYIDSSVVLARILKQEIALDQAIAYPTACASEFLEIECARVLQRYRLLNQLDDFSLLKAKQALDCILESISIIPCGKAVKIRAASAFPTIIGTLDAIHLSSALLMKDHFNEQIFLFSHDRQLNVCAAACGLAVPLFE